MHEALHILGGCNSAFGSFYLRCVLGVCHRGDDYRRQGNRCPNLADVPSRLDAKRVVGGEQARHAWPRRYRHSGNFCGAIVPL